MPLPLSPSSLETLALQRYLHLLQDCCAGFVRLAASDSYLLDTVRTRVISCMKEELRGHLRGTASSALRQEMAERILRGEFPTQDYHNQYEPLCEASYETEQDLNKLEEVTQAGRKCNSVCCTGAFIAETMLAIVVNEDVKKLDFNLKKDKGAHTFWNKNKMLKKYVTFQVPAVLAHYTEALREAYDRTTAKLERLSVIGTDIPSRQYATKYNTFQVLTNFTELVSYLEIPGTLSEDAGGQQYGAFAEHLVLALGDMFQLKDSFPRLTEIVLGREACNTNLRMGSGPGNRDISNELFCGIGKSCPNLKVLDVSQAICLSPECLLFLFFHDTYHSLHKFVYLPELLLNFEDRLVQNDECELKQIRHHNNLKYCPYCLDDWCVNGVRENLTWSDIQTPVVDDRIYTGVKGMFGEKAKKYLLNVITAKDLVKSITAPFKKLVRPPGLRPWDPGFVPPEESGLKDHGYYWIEPNLLEARYEPVDFCFPTLNPIASSLQCLKLNMDSLWPKHEIVPFLLKAMPNVKSLGHVNVVKGLKMIRDILGLEGITASNLEEIDFGHMGSQAALSNTNWADNEIGDFVQELGHHLFDERLDHPEERRELLRKDVELVASQCPRLRRMEVYLYGDTPYIRESDGFVWEPFRSLSNLQELSVFSHDWSETVALMHVLGPQLKKIFLSLDGRGNMWNENAHQNVEYTPLLHDFMELCPAIEDVTMSFGVRRVNVSSATLSDNASFPALRNFSVQTYMTKRAFTYLWARCPNVESLNVSYLSMTDAFPQLGTPAVIFDEVEIRRLLRSNPMLRLERLSAHLTVKDIETAKVLIEGLPAMTSLSTLVIRVGLPQEDYPNQEQMLLGLAHVMQAMRQFKFYCAEKGANGQQIQWKWERFGFLESFAEIEQLNALIEPNL